MADQHPLVLSYLAIRRAIGLVGLLLPFVLLAGVLVTEGPPLPGSISAYYYSNMRNVLVGALCAIGVFLVCYRGYAPLDAVSSNIAGAAAIGVALFPTRPDDATQLQIVVGFLHLTFATIFFGTLAFIAGFVFTLSDGWRTRAKRRRDAVYRVCAVLIAGAPLLAVAADNLLPRATVDALHPVYWLETVAVVAFAVSWLVKGEALGMLND